MLKIELVDRDNYIHFVDKHPLRNFLQYPSWSDLKTEWKWSSEFIGWFNKSHEMVGGANILYRKVPGLNKFLAYIPRGPLIDWLGSYKLKEWFAPLFQHLKKAHAFSVKIDPPLVHRKWTAQTIVKQLEQFRYHQLKHKKLTDIPPDEVYNEVEFIQQELAEMGWRQVLIEDSFDTVQPQYTYRLPLSDQSFEQIYQQFHPSHQEKILQAEKAGVQIELGTEEDLPEYYQLMVQQAKKEQTTVREMDYFVKMFEALTFEDPYRLRFYLARDKNQQLLCGALAIRIQGQTWDLYNVQLDSELAELANLLMRWQMIKDAHQMGDQIFDFRGVGIDLEETSSHFELLQLKLGFGGEACELMGEWDYPVVPMLHWVFDMYMKRR